MAKSRKESGRNGTPKPGKGGEGKLTIKNLPIRHNVPPATAGVFANHVVVRGDPSNFHLFFFDAQPPIDLELDSKSQEITEMEAHCVARVVIPPHILPGLIKALQANMEKQKVIAATMAAQLGKAAK